MAYTESVTRGVVPERADHTLRKKITSQNNVALIHTDVTSATLTVYDPSQPGGTTPTALYGPVSLTIGDGTSTGIWRDTLSTTGWTVDGVGYNMTITVAGNAYTMEGGKELLYEVALTLNSGGPAGASGISVISFLVRILPRMSV